MTAYFRDALAAEPRAPEVKILAAEAALRAGDIREAKRLVQLILAVYPSHPEARSLQDDIDFESSLR